MTPEEVIANNAKIIAQRGPGLWHDLGVYVEAKDPKARKVLLGGLGGLGVGRMWFDDDGTHDDLAGYSTAPVSECPRELELDRLLRVEATYRKD